MGIPINNLLSCRNVLGHHLGRYEMFSLPQCSLPCHEQRKFPVIPASASFPPPLSSPRLYNHRAAKTCPDRVWGRTEAHVLLSNPQQSHKAHQLVLVTSAAATWLNFTCWVCLKEVQRWMWCSSDVFPVLSLGTWCDNKDLPQPPQLLV